ncbi:hypothetical protein DJ010_08885 [Nocardioides silvaticus]|uniref:SHOCT domain-containing protein n=1 Tax=Nocardioides silvaticus TaxID=2201891 RepID=A0A316TM62_9ACTN|nr:SHOCT domain-containing protein [Nocardioides silvaticus]PWN03224.1 hypothetical protein DJ010_08885 [Nocardioides silvaticus]
MKLASLGVVTALIGVFLGIPGLIGVGALWVVVGLVVWRFVQPRIKAREQAAAEPGPDGKPAAPKTPWVGAGSFVVGTAIYMVLGIPSLLVGALLIGIPDEHENWRWLPLVIGVIAVGIGVLSGVLYLTGSALSAAAGPAPTVPATIRIRSVRETGTYINERPRLEFELRVEPDAETEAAPYDVTKKATVPFTAIGSLRVGDGFRALVAGPEDPTSMEIDWDTPVPGTAAAPTGAGDVTARLAQLEELRRLDQITVEEYEAQRERILGTL